MNSSPNTRLEIEVKFLLSDLDQFRERLISASAKLITNKIHEDNIRYDTQWQSLRLQGKLLRLRHDNTVTLTFKGPAKEDAHSEARVREELEIKTNDFDTLAAILERVGFEPVQVYEKYRETFRMGEVEIVLDQLPFGDFVELEGKEIDLIETAEKLGFDWSERILANYLAIMEWVKDYYKLPFNDLTFENFDGLDISLAEVMQAEQPSQ